MLFVLLDLSPPTLLRCMSLSLISLLIFARVNVVYSAEAIVQRCLFSLRIYSRCRWLHDVSAMGDSLVRREK
jgi:hypothetical protein